MSGAFEFILAGMLVGFCVGITGVGGGSLMTPILIGLLGLNRISQLVLIYFTPRSLSSVDRWFTQKLNIVWPIVLWLAVGSIPASFGTAWVLEHYLSQSTHYKAVLTMVLGFMLTLTGVSIIFRTRIEKFFNKFRNKENTQTENEQLAVQNKRTYIVIMGIILGVFVTLSSVGAGAFGIMALVIMFPNLPMIRIIGSDVVHAVLLTLVAGLGHMSAGNVDFVLLMWLLVGSIPAIIIGTLISSRMPERLIRKILVLHYLLLVLTLWSTQSKPNQKQLWYNNKQ